MLLDVAWLLLDFDISTSKNTVKYNKLCLMLLGFAWFCLILFGFVWFCFVVVLFCFVLNSVLLDVDWFSIWRMGWTQITKHKGDMDVYAHDTYDRLHSTFKWRYSCIMLRRLTLCCTMLRGLCCFVTLRHAACRSAAGQSAAWPSRQAVAI